MHANRYWWLFLVCIASVVCWKSGVALYRLYGYYRLTAHAEASLSDWSVVKLAEDSYVLKTRYRFQSGQRVFSADYLYYDSPYLNAWGAEKAIGKAPSKGEVWYSARNPLVSTLQKNYPLKECLSAAALWALLLYFIWLGYYVASYGSDRSQKSNH